MEELERKFKIETTLHRWQSLVFKYFHGVSALYAWPYELFHFLPDIFCFDMISLFYSYHGLFSKLYIAKNNRNPKRDQLIAYNGKVFYHATKEEDIWELDLYKCKIKSLNSCVTMTKSPLVQARLQHMKFSFRFKLPAVALFYKR